MYTRIKLQTDLAQHLLTIMRPFIAKGNTLSVNKGSIHTSLYINTPFLVKQAPKQLAQEFARKRAQIEVCLLSIDILAIALINNVNAGIYLQ